MGLVGQNLSIKFSNDMIQFIIVESLAIGVFWSCVWDPDGTGKQMAGFDNSVV